MFLKANQTEVQIADKFGFQAFGFQAFTVFEKDPGVQFQTVAHTLLNNLLWQIKVTCDVIWGVILLILTYLRIIIAIDKVSKLSKLKCLIIWQSKKGYYVQISLLIFL